MPSVALPFGLITRYLTPSIVSITASQPAMLMASFLVRLVDLVVGTAERSETNTPPPAELAVLTTLVV